MTKSGFQGSKTRFVVNLAGYLAFKLINKRGVFNQPTRSLQLRKEFSDKLTQVDELLRELGVDDDTAYKAKDAQLYTWKNNQKHSIKQGVYGNGQDDGKGALWWEMAEILKLVDIGASDDS